MNRILIVEDEKMIRYGIHVMVEDSGVPYQILEECRNGKEALEYLKKDKYDLVITDIKMPFMGGIELSKYITCNFDKEDRPELIAISGYAEFDYVKSIMKDGAIDYILKPIDREELKNSLWHAEKIYREKHHDEIEHKDNTNEEAMTFVNKKKMQEAIDYIRKNYHNPIDMVEVSNHVSLNYTMFSAEFKKYTSQNFTAYLKKYRIEKAKKMFQSTELKISEVAKMVGFEDARYFAKTFKKETGKTPSEYRE